MNDITGRCRMGMLLAGASALALLAGCERAAVAPPVPATEIAAIDTPPPEYPLELACAEIGGKVVLTLTVGIDGRVAGARIRKSSGQPAFDAAALEAVRDWRFRPATRNGQPVETEISVPMTFNAPAEEPAACYEYEQDR